MSTNTNSADNQKSVPAPGKGVPLLDLGRQYAQLRDETAAALLRVCDSGQFVLGPAVTELEKRVANYCCTPHALAVRRAATPCCWP